jgi:hypothetical protein
MRVVHHQLQRAAAPRVTDSVMTIIGDAGRSSCITDEEATSLTSSPGALPPRVSPTVSSVMQVEGHR